MICFNQKLCYIQASMLLQFNNSENRSIAVEITSLIVSMFRGQSDSDSGLGTAYWTSTTARLDTALSVAAAANVTPMPSHHLAGLDHNNSGQCPTHLCRPNACQHIVYQSQPRQQPVALSVQQSVKNYRDRQSSDSATIGRSDSPIVTIVLTLVVTAKLPTFRSLSACITHLTKTLLIYTTVNCIVCSFIYQKVSWQRTKKENTT